MPKSLKRKPDETILRIVVASLLIAIILTITLAQTFYAQHKGERRIFGNVKFEEHHGNAVTIYDNSSDPQILIEGHIGLGLPHDDHPYKCKGHKSTDTEKCLEWHRKASLTINHYKEGPGINCYNLVWVSQHNSMSPMDCFPPGQGHWYGGGESLQASWPWENGHIKSSPFITGDEGQTEWGNAIKKYFVNTNGVVLTIEDQTPLFLSIDQDHGLCIQARYDDFAYFYHRSGPIRLNYTLCAGGKDDGQGDLKKLHEHFLPKTFWDATNVNYGKETVKSLEENPLWQVLVLL